MEKLPPAFLQFAAQHGPWAALAIVLIVMCYLLVRWVFVTSNEREIRLTDIINKQSTALQGLSDAQKQVSERLERMDDNITDLSQCVDRIERRLP
jgi:peptidoglycan hydrolase CwlO-like protein